MLTPDPIYILTHIYYLLGKPIYYQLVIASTWISLSITVLGILVQDTHPLTSLIALVVTGDINSNTSAQIHYNRTSEGLMQAVLFSVNMIIYRGGCCCWQDSGSCAATWMRCNVLTWGDAGGSDGGV